jgi:hypothetical protein
VGETALEFSQMRPLHSASGERWRPLQHERERRCFEYGGDVAESLRAGGSAYKRRQAHQTPAAHARKTARRFHGVICRLRGYVQNHRHAAIRRSQHSLSGTIYFGFRELPPFACEPRKGDSIRSRIAREFHFSCESGEVDRLALIERRLKNRDYAGEPQEPLQVPVKTTRSSGSPRAKRSRFAAICRARRAIIGAVQAELWGVTSTFGSS